MSAFTIGRYRIVEEQGASPLGRRLLARDGVTGRPVIVETLEALDALGPEERGRVREHLLRAARAACGLSHPAIVGLTDVEQDEGRVFLVGPAEEGTSLDVWCRGPARLPRAVAVDLVARAAEGLAHAHRRGVLHGHLTPARLRQVRGGVRIDGFGLALPGHDPLSGKTATPEAAAYLSPEQVRGRVVDGRSDLFSLATILYELLSGSRAFPGDSVQSIVYRVVNEPPPDPARLEPPIPEALAGPLLRALSKDPEERFADGDAFAAALRAVPAGAPHSDSEPASPPTVAKDDRSPAARHAARRPSIVPILFGLLLLAGAAVAVVWRSREGSAPPADAPTTVWWETLVRTEPPGLRVTLDGDPIEGATVRFPSSGPFGVLAATHGCRKVEHTLGPQDAGGEVVLVADPLELEVTIDPGVSGATLTRNGKRAGTLPATLTLDLCESNRLELRAAGHRPFAIDLPAGATPLEVRKAIYAVSLDPIPRGWLVLPRPPGLELTFHVDGRKIRSRETEVELEEGIHRLGVKNDFHWIDEEREVAVVPGERVRPTIGPFPLATLRVQAFPSNCEVHLRRPGGEWRFLDETPVERRVVAGRYEVRVTLKPTGDRSVREVDLVEGDNPPMRFSFGGRS